MKPAVEISPSPTGEGVLMRFQGAESWFAEEHHAIGFAQDAHPGFDIVLYGPEGGIRRRYTPGRSEEGVRTDSEVMTPPPRPPAPKLDEAES